MLLNTSTLEWHSTDLSWNGYVPPVISPLPDYESWTGKYTARKLSLCELQLEHYTFKAEAQIDADPEGYGRRVYERLVQRMIGNGTTSASVFGTISVEAK